MDLVPFFSCETWQPEGLQVGAERSGPKVITLSGGRVRFTRWPATNRDQLPSIGSAFPPYQSTVGRKVSFLALHTKIDREHKDLISIGLHCLLDNLVQITFTAVSAKEMHNHKGSDVQSRCISCQSSHAKSSSTRVDALR